MEAEVQGHPARNQPHEGSSKGSSSCLHGRPGTTNRIIHNRGVALHSSVKFRIQHIETFNGAKDPINHLNTYKNQMELHEYHDPVRCRAFTITLKGPTLAWFNPPAVITHMLNVNPSCPSKEALLLKRKRAEAIKKENKAPRDKQTGTDPQGGAEKTESGPDKMRERQGSQGTTLA